MVRRGPLSEPSPTGSPSTLWATLAAERFGSVRAQNAPSHPAEECHFAGRGLKVCPSAVDNPTNIRVAGDEHGMSVGLSVSVGDCEQFPEEMSLFTIVTTDVSVVVS